MNFFGSNFKIDHALFEAVRQMMETNYPVAAIPIDPNYPNNCDITWDVDVGNAETKAFGYIRGEDMELAAKRFCQHYSVSEEMIPKLVNLIKLHPTGDGYPLKEPQLFARSSSQLETAIKRLHEDNEAQRGILKLTPREILMIAECLSNNSLSSPSEVCECLDKALFNWPTKNLLPILDVLRLLLLDERFNSYYFSDKMGTNFTNCLIEVLLSDVESNIKYVVFLALCNAFNHPDGRRVLCADVKKWMDVVAKLLPETKLEKIQVVISKFVGNYAAVQIPISPHSQERHLSPYDILCDLVVILKKLSDRSNFRFTEQSAQRFLLAMITLMWGNHELVAQAKDLGILYVINRFKDEYSDETNQKLAQELSTMIESLEGPRCDARFKRYL